MNPAKHHRPARRQSVTDDFERETKLVVLNFLGLVPASCPATAEVCDTVRVDVCSDDDADDMQPQQAHGALPAVNCDLQPVPELQSEEDCSVVTGPIHNGELIPHCGGELVDNEGVCTAEVVVSAEDGDEAAGGETSLVQPTSTALSADQLRLNRNSTHQAAQSSLLLTPVIPASSRTPSPCSAIGPALLERQSSSRSTTSSRSRSSATRNSSINVQLADLERLVRTHSLPPLVIPLRDEISREMAMLGCSGQEASDGRDDGDDADADGPAVQDHAHSPETEVADMLRAVGDQVNEEFGEMLSAAVAAILPAQAGNQDIQYSTLQSVAARLIGRVHPGWSQVAMVLLLSQRVAFSMLSQGHNRIGSLADNTTRFIEDHVADFIISNGGWQSILDMEVTDLLPESSNEARSSADELHDRGQSGDTDQRVSPQGHCENDANGPLAEAGHELIPDRSQVPLLSRDVSAVPGDICPTNVNDTDGDSDVFVYLALGATVLVFVAALYKQVVK